MLQNALQIMEDTLDNVEVSGTASMYKLENNMYCIYAMPCRVIVKYCMPLPCSCTEMDLQATHYPRGTRWLEQKKEFQQVYKFEAAIYKEDLRHTSVSLGKGTKASEPPGYPRSNEDHQDLSLQSAQKDER